MPAADGMDIVTCNDFFTCQNSAKPAMSITSPTPAHQFTVEVVPAQVPSTSLFQLSAGHG